MDADTARVLELLDELEDIADVIEHRGFDDPVVPRIQGIVAELRAGYDDGLRADEVFAEGTDPLGGAHSGGLPPAIDAAFEFIAGENPGPE